MKKIVTVMLAVIILASAALMTSCSDRGDSGEDTREEFRVGLECANVPFNWTQLDGSNGAVRIEGTKEYCNGYDVKIAKVIADALDRKLVIVKLKWEGLIPAVQSGAIDMIIAGMSPTAERKESIDFTNAYYNSEVVVVVRKDGKYAEAKTLADLDGAKITAQIGTYHEALIDQIPNVQKQTSMADMPAIIVALKSKSIDGYLAERPGAIADCAVNSDFVYIPLETNKTGFTVEDISITEIAAGVKKGSELTEKVNSIISGITPEMRNTLMENAIAQAPKD